LYIFAAYQIEGKKDRRPPKRRGLSHGGFSPGAAHALLRIILAGRRPRSHFADHRVAAQALEHVEMLQVFPRFVPQHGDAAGWAMTDDRARARVQGLILGA
jgi:hypothetical protein